MFFLVRDTVVVAAARREMEAAPAVATPTRIGESEARGARLWEAAERRDVASISRELEGGAYVDYAGRSQWTALHRAADRGWLDILRILIQAYAPSALNSMLTLAAFALARALCGPVFVRTSGSSLNAGSGRGASVNRTTGSGHDTALHLAAAKGHADVARELVKAGADFRSKAKNGWTPLHTAMFHNSAAVARILLRAGADPLSETEVRFPHLGVCLDQLKPKAFPRLTNSASLHAARKHRPHAIRGPGEVAAREHVPAPRVPRRLRPNPAAQLPRPAACRRSCPSPRGSPLCRPRAEAGGER